MEHYMPATESGGQSDVTKSKGFINLSDGAYLQAVFSFIDAEAI